MTPIATLLAELAQRDIRLSLDGDLLRVDAPKGAVTAELRATLLARKADLLSHFRGSHAAPSGLQPARIDDHDEPERVSPGQRRILAVARARGGGQSFHVPTLFRLAGQLDIAALAQSLADLERRHDALRTTFEESGGRPYLCVHPPSAPGIDVDDLVPQLAGLDGAARERAILQRAAEEVRRPFDLERGPLWRARLLRTDPDAHLLVLTMHHVVFDGRSKPIYLAEAAELYRARVAGVAPSLPGAPPPYGTFARWQRKAANDAGASGRLAHWQRTLAGLAGGTELPVDRARPAAPVRGAGSVAFEIDPPTARALRAYARREQGSPFIVLLAAFAALLHGRSGQDDLLVCSPFAARDRAEFERMIGYLNTLVLLRVQVDPRAGFDDLVRRVRAVVFDAFQHQQVPLQRLAELPELARVPFARAMFSYQDTSSRTLDLPGIVATPVVLRKDASDFDLAMYAEGTRDGGLGGVLEYDADQFDEATIASLLADFRHLLDAVAIDPQRPLDGLPRTGRTWRDAEAILAAHPGIAQSVVVRRRGHVGPVAWLVLDEDHAPSLEQVRAHVAASMPLGVAPTALVTVDRMPLLPDGRIDVDALPAPPALRRRSGTPARTPLERELASIWQRVLWLDEPVGVDEDFTDLGGHSLISAQLIVEVEAALGRPLPLAAVTRIGTVEAMARAIEAGGARPPDAEAPDAGQAGTLPPDILRGLRLFTSSWAGARARPESLVIGLNTDGARIPLFWCLQRQQELAQLGRYLGPDQPVYGMRNGHKVMERGDENIEKLAAHYVGEILALCPAGPLFVGGNCGATRVSFAMARQLAERGRTPALLVMHEKFIPRAYAGALALMFGRASDRNPYTTFQRPEVGWRKYYGGPLTFDFVQGAHAEFFVEPNVQVLVGAIARRLDEAASGVPPADAIAAREGPGQPLPERAYRARIAPRPVSALDAGERRTIVVDVVNDSPVRWLAYEHSGIALVDRWRRAEGATLAWHDGWSALPSDLAPGDRASIEIEVRAPDEAGRHRLEFDLVDEGVATFASKGSPVGTLDVDVLAPAPATKDYNPHRPSAGDPH